MDFQKIDKMTEKQDKLQKEAHDLIGVDDSKAREKLLELTKLQVDMIDEIKRLHKQA